MGQNDFIADKWTASEVGFIGKEELSIKIKKILNTNAVIVQDEGREKIAIGNGIAFNKKRNDIVASGKIEKLFVMQNNKGLLQSGSSVITENILTSAKLTYFKSETSSEVVGSVDRNSIIKVDYTWKLEDGHRYKDGTTFTFNLPSELKVKCMISPKRMKIYR